MEEKQINKYPLQEYDIWMSASGAQGDHNTSPIFVGKAVGRNFQDACMRHFMVSEIACRVEADSNDEYYDTKRWDYNPYRNTYWACSLGETKESVEWKR
jgi:hypothetical protein